MDEFIGEASFFDEAFGSNEVANPTALGAANLDVALLDQTIQH